MSTQELVDQLWEIYQLETWHKEKLNKEEADIYHKRILDSGNCITVSDNGLLCGYVEFYRNNGCCYVHNLFIRPEYRMGKVIRKMKKRLFEVCGNIRVYLGDRNKQGKRYAECQLRRQHGR